MIKKIIYINNIFPLYRKPIWELLLKEKNYNFNIYYSDQEIDEIKTFKFSDTYPFKNKLHKIKNIFFFKTLIWQNKVLKIILKKNFEVAIFMGDMTIISTWIGALICRIFKKKVVFWGHGLYGNESVFKKYFRIIFLKLADINLTYENRSKKLLIKSGFKENNIKVIYNSLDYDKQLKLFNRLENDNKKRTVFKKNKLPIVVFIGRLYPKKKIEILVETIYKINKKKSKVNFLIVGDGPEKNNLELLCSKLLKKENYFFYGKTFDELELSNLLYHSSLCVSPGNIGLTAIHSLSYGTPVASHDNFKYQMPEVESIINGENGFLFKYDDIQDLSEKILIWINKKINKRIVRKIIDEKYNPNYQKKIIDSIIRK